MKKVISGAELYSLLEAVHQKHPRGLLVIESEFEIYLVNHDFKHLLPEVVSGKISNRKVISDSIKATQKLIRLAQADLANMRKCASYIQEKFPHAFFSSGDFSIGVHNLTREEISHCLAKKGLRFYYYNN